MNDLTIVALDCPSELAEHPDARIECGKVGLWKSHPEADADGYQQVIGKVLLTGCKVCQRVTSKCRCAELMVGARRVKAVQS